MDHKMNKPTPLEQITAAVNQVVNSTPVNDSEAYILDAAKGRLREMRVLLQAVTGEGDPHSPRLRPLSRAVNDFIMSLDRDNQKEYAIDSIEDADQVEQMLLEREEIEGLLNQARISALSMLAHLDAAAKALAKLDQL